MGTKPNKIEMFIEQLANTNFEDGSSYWVDVTHIDNPHNFYVRPTNYKHFLSDLQLYGDNIDEKEAQMGAIIIYKSETLQSYIRGQIVLVYNVNENKTCDIFAVDNGWMEKSVPLSHIYKPCNNLNVPSLVKSCRLVNCYPLGTSWDEVATQVMKKFIANERTQILIRSKTSNQLIVELSTTSPPDISTLLTLAGYTAMCIKKHINRNTAPEPERDYFTFKKLTKGDSLHVRVQSIENSFNGFYVAQIDDYKAYLKYKLNMTLWCCKQIKLSAENISERKTVCVVSDSNEGSYERAMVKEVFNSENTALVQLVDWGTTFRAKFDKMTRISQTFVRKPVVAIYCAIERSEWYSQYSALNKNLLPGMEFMITIKEVGDKFCTPNIVEIDL